MDRKKRIEVKGEKSLVVLPHGMTDEEKAVAAREYEARNDPDRLPDNDPDEEYPR